MVHFEKGGGVGGYLGDSIHGEIFKQGAPEGEIKGGATSRRREARC
jgi:hypothetical protein